MASPGRPCWWRTTANCCFVAPKGLPPAVLEKAHAAFVEALNDPKVKDQFTSIGFEMVANTPAEFAAFQQAEYARWKKVIETGKITID